MYETFYHLSTDPFRLTPNPKFCFRHHSYKQAWAYLLYAFRQAEGFVMITGRAGTGKTTLIEAFQQELKQSRVVAARIASSNLEATDLLRAIAYTYGIAVEGLDKASLLLHIEQFLLKQMRCGKRVLLIIDEAQGLRCASLEELRLLADLHTDTQPLLQVFLVGQEKLQSILSAMDMEQFQQRVIGAYHLETMDLAETRGYVEHRLQRTGWRGDPQLTGQAVVNIYLYSNGVPRHVNKICSRLLLYGSLENKHELDEEDVLTVAAELNTEQLAPLDQDQTAFAQAQAEERTWETELKEASLSIDDLAIRTINQPERAPMNAAKAENAEGEMRDKVTTPVSKTRAAQQQSVAVHGSPVTSDAQTTASAQPEIRIRQPLHQLVNWTGVLYRNAVQAGTFLLQRIKQWSAALWNWGRSNRFAGRLNWQGELAVVAGLLVVITLFVTDFPLHQARNDGENHSLTMSEFEPTPLLAIDTGRKENPDMANLAVVYEAMPTKVVAMPLVALPREKADAGASLDAGSLLHDSELAKLDSNSAGVTPDTAPAFDQSGDLDHELLDPKPSNLILVAVESAEPPLAKSENPADITKDTAKETPTIQPQGIADGETGENATPHKAIASMEPLTVETQEQPLPVADAVQEKIADLLVLGRESVQTDRLLFPEGNSAFHYYQQVLALEPGNRSALQGIEQIVKRYLALAGLAMERNDMEKANRYVARGLRVQPGDQRLVALQDSLREPPVIAKAEPPLPPSIPIDEQPQAVETEPATEGFFSRIKDFFTANHVMPEEAPIWEEGNSDF